MAPPLDDDAVSQVQRPAFEFGFRATPLPPPRAARTPRSRGTFLEQPESGNTPPTPKRRPAKRALSMVALAIAVVAVASALIVGAPSAMLGSSVTINPGAAIVGATSVAPAFLKHGDKALN